MKITVADEIFRKINDICIGIIAAKGINNHGCNKEVEAFRRRCSTEVNLFLKMQKDIAVKERTFYQLLGKKLGIEARHNSLDLVCREYKDALAQYGIKSEANELNRVSLDELMASDVLPSKNSLLDLVRSGMLKFHVPIDIYDAKDKNEEFCIVYEKYPIVKRGTEMIAVPWCIDSETEIIEETKNVWIVIVGTSDNRKVVAATRNELARRIKSAFNCDVETGWLEGSVTVFDTSI